MPVDGERDPEVVTLEAALRSLDEAMPEAVRDIRGRLRAVATHGGSLTIGAGVRAEFAPFHVDDAEIEDIVASAYERYRWALLTGEIEPRVSHGYLHTTANQQYQRLYRRGLRLGGGLDDAALAEPEPVAIEDLVDEQLLREETVRAEEAVARCTCPDWEPRLTSRRWEALVETDRPDGRDREPLTARVREACAKARNAIAPAAMDLLVELLGLAVPDDHQPDDRIELVAVFLETYGLYAWSHDDLVRLSDQRGLCRSGVGS